MPVLDPVVLEVKSPAPKGLPGLDFASAKLTAMLARLREIQTLLNQPTEVRLVYRNADAGMSAIRSKARELRKDLKSFTAVDIAEMFKFDKDRFLALIANAEQELTRHLSRRKNPPRALRASTGEFEDLKIAGAAVAMMSRELAREVQMNLSEFMRKAWQPVVPAAGAPPTPSATSAAKVPAPATAAAAPTTAPYSAGVPPRPPAPPVATRPFQGPPSGAPLLELREIIPADASRNLTRIRKYLTSVGETLRVYASAPQTGGPEEVSKEERVVSRVAPAVRDLRASMADAQRQLLEMQAQGRATPAALAGMMRQMASKLEEASKGLRSQGLGQDTEADRALIHARRLQAQATKLDAAAARQAESHARQNAKAALESVAAHRAQAVARGDPGERVRLAQELEDALQRQGGALTPRDAARVRGQIARLRGSDQAKAILTQRSQALDAIAEADTQTAAAMQRGGLTAVAAREQAAAARRTLLESPSASALTPRQRYRLQAQQARLQVQAEKGWTDQIAAGVRRQLEQAWSEGQSAMARMKGKRVVQSAAPLRRLLDEHGAKLDQLERNRWERRIAQLEGNARAAREAYAAQDRRAAERSGRARAGMGRAAQSAAERRTRDAARVAEFEEGRRQAARSVSDAQRIIQEEQAAGARMVRRKVGRRPGGVSNFSVMTERETDTGIRRVSAVFSDAGARVEEFERALKATRAELGAAGRDFFRNTLTVTAWAASVGTLYGSLGLLRQGVTAFRDLDLATARLSAVFRGNQGEVRGLVDDVLRLAAAEGRSSSEAVDSAIRWARVGYTRGQVLQAVEVSLKAANVAEITAAEATEKLMGVTAAYNLHARDLNDVLGMLNQTSNTWNASNAEMLTGLTRTASVARQAKIPLAELVGTLGATIGTTGQSGANIGNAIKSLVTNLASPELQKRLREGFQFEVMMGEGDIASASDILRELFVSYQEFSRAQRQSLLYFAAGRTQASRMAAILDSYVRAQVLAINAQLRLNSAEQENIRIRETLQNQMQGLVTEFERFSNLQMASGPIGTALKSAVETLRNVFKLGAELTRSGGDRGAWVQQGLMGLTGLIAARLAVTGVQMGRAGKGGGGMRTFVGNTLGRVAGAGVALKETLDASTRGFMMDRWGLRQRFGADTWTGRAVRGLQRGEDWARQFSAVRRQAAGLGIARLQGEMTALARVGVVGSMAWNRALATVGLTTRALLMSVRATLIAVRSMFVTLVVPMALLAAGMAAFNKVMERAGASIDGVSERLAQLEQQADAAGHAADAAERGIQLSETVERALLGQQDPDARRKMLKDLADAQVFSATARQKLNAAAEGTDTAAVHQVLEEERARLRIEASLQRAGRLRFENHRRSEAQAELDRLNAIKSGGGSLFGSDARQRNMAELQAQIAQSQERTIQLILDENDALRENLELRGRAVQAEAALAGAAETQRSLLEGLPTTGEAGRGAARVAGIQAALEKRRTDLAGLKEAEKLTAADLAERDRTKVDLQRELDRLREDLAIEQERLSPGMEAGLGGGDTSRRDALLREVRDKETQLGEVANAPTGRMTAVQQLQQRTNQAIEQLEGELAREMAAQPYRMRRDEFELRSQMARTELGAADYGLDEGDRLNRRLEAARAMAADSQEQASPVTGDEQRAAETVRWMTAQREIMEALQEGQRTINDLKRQENQLIADARRELERTLLTANPTEMLRRVAAARLGQQGVTPGQFFAAAPELRGALAQLFPAQFSPEVAQVRRARSRLDGRPEFGSEGLVDNLRETLRVQEEALTQMSVTAANLALSDSAMSAHESLTMVSESAVSAAEALGQLPAIVQQLISGSAPGGNRLPPNRTVQGNGNNGI